MNTLSFTSASAPYASARYATARYATAPEEKRFSFSNIIQPIRKVGQFASKVADVAGKVAVVASIL